MAVTSSDTKGGYATLHFTGNDFHNLAHVQNSNETVSGLRTSSVTWSANNSGTWSLSRGGNTILTLVGSGSVNFQAGAIQVELFNHPFGDQGNVAVTLVGAGPTSGTIIWKLKKISNYTSSTDSA
mgnify:CR=1 FL=1|tara:strand:- start:19582 stop:19956 length:375 start_codon:yes stop_codon:yes gene_type:complete